MVKSRPSLETKSTDCYIAGDSRSPKGCGTHGASMFEPPSTGPSRCSVSRPPSSTPSSARRPATNSADSQDPRSTTVTPSTSVAKSSFWLLPLVALLVLIPTLSQALDEAPPSSLRLLLVSGEQAEPQPIPNGATLPRSAEVVFEVFAQSGVDYLYLLQQQGDGLQVLLPTNGLVWMRPSGTSRVAPRAPDASAEEAASSTWSADQTGELEFILVAAKAPRDVPSDGRISSLERFLLPPPFVRGPAASPATVLARRSVLWLEDDPDANVR